MHSVFRKFNRTQSVCSAMHSCITAPIAEVGVANYSRFIVNFVSGVKTLNVQMDDFDG